MFFHGFEQRALCFGRRAIHLVGQNQLGEYGAWLKFELAAVPAEHGNADDIGRQQVAGELDATEAEAEHAGQGLRQHRLAESRQVFDQQVATGQQAGNGQGDLLLLPEDDATERGARLVDDRMLGSTAGRYGLECG